MEEDSFELRDEPELLRGRRRPELRRPLQRRVRGVDRKPVRRPVPRSRTVFRGRNPEREELLGGQGLQNKALQLHQVLRRVDPLALELHQ